MSARAHLAPALTALSIVIGAGCASKQLLPAPATAASPAARTRVVLLRDLETDSVGRALVTNAAGTVELTSDHASTAATEDAPPSPSATIDASEVIRTFGGALAALPSPSAHFILHFQLGSEELTDESRAEVTDVIQAIQRREIPYVTVIGHTDTTGKDAENFVLGLVRAQSVRSLLLRSGLPPSSVEALSLGERDLLIRTADETPEPRNRRVEIAVR